MFALGIPASWRCSQGGRLEIEGLEAVPFGARPAANVRPVSNTGGFAGVVRFGGIGPWPCLICSHALKSFVFDLASSALELVHAFGASALLNLEYFWAPVGGGEKLGFVADGGGGRGGGGYLYVGDLGGGLGGGVGFLSIYVWSRPACMRFASYFARCEGSVRTSLADCMA